MRSVPIIVCGIGGIGRTLLRQILSNRKFHADHYGIRLDLVGLVDSRGMVGSLKPPLEDQRVSDLLEWKLQGNSLAERLEGTSQSDFAGAVRDWVGKETILVDCTATAEMAPVILETLRLGGRAVLANKKPLTVEQEVFDELDFFSRQGLCRWEATVGSGLPVIVTLNRLVASGDEMRRVEGTFSGTLGFLMTNLQQGMPFSQTVREAFDAGYTEPDPRDDLAGLDVARKALILARGMGWKINLSQVAVESLYPQELDSLPVEEFLCRLTAVDEPFRERVRQADRDRKVLRYAARIEAGNCHVGPAQVPKDSPLGRLKGTDNVVEFHSRWYTPSPLVVRGRGAGVHATAAGVLSDIVELAVTLRTKCLNP